MKNNFKDFMSMLCGTFDNKKQYEEFKAKGIEDFPYAEHVNTICNDKITGIPEDFKGVFMLEESYYTVNGKTRAMPHLFLFVDEGDDVKLISYEIPEGYNKETFKYENLKDIEFSKLTLSGKFTPAIYKKNGDSWEGGSESMFSPTMKFTLFEKFSNQQLEVSEIIENNGRRVFGYDHPIIYISNVE